MFSLYPTICETLRPAQKLPICEWLRSNVRFERGPIIGPFDIEHSPWIREPLEQMRDHGVREIICACSVQSAKTAMLEGAVLYNIAEHGGDACIYCQTDEDTNDFIDKRFRHRILATPSVASMLVNGSRSIQKRATDFAHMTLFSLGAHDVANLQSRALRHVYGDEAAYWIEGHIDESRKRTTAYDIRNSKRIYVSTPLDDSGEFFASWQSGTQSEWHVRCPACGEGHELRWQNIRWETAGAKLTDGGYDFAKIAPTVRYECPNEACQARLTDDPRTRKQLAASGYYVAINQAPDPKVRSYHWNALTVPWVPWADLVVEFLKAEHAARLGDWIPRMEFVRKRLGEFWSAQNYQTEEVNLSSGFKMGEAWEHEFMRYGACDVQKDYLCFGCRAFARDGSSRLIFAARFLDWPALKETVESLKILPSRMFVDCGFEATTVYRQCADNGWVSLKGEAPRLFYTHVGRDSQGKPSYVKRPYSPISKIDASLGIRKAGEKRKFAVRLLFSTMYVKQILLRLKSGQGAPWELAADTPSWYHRELSGEILAEERDKKTGRKKLFLKKLGANHAFDVESMMLVGASIDKLLGDQGVAEETTVKEPAEIVA